MAGLDSYVTGLYSFNNDWEDRSGNGLDFTVGSALGFSTTKKFGTHAMSGGGWAGRQTAAATGQYDFGSGDFTVDFWCRLSNAGQSAMILVCVDKISNSYWRIMWRNTFDIEFTSRNTSNNVTSNFKTSTAPCNTYSQWYHIAVVRNGNDEYIFVDGVSQSLTVSTGFSGDIGLSSTVPLKVGYDPDDTYGYWGNIDELRISKGIARWTSNFTPPTAEYSEADISGVLSSEARVLVIDESSWTVEHSDVHSAGSYTIPAAGGGGLKTVVAVPTTSGTAPLVYKNVTPAS